ncbi:MULTISPECIES: YbfB/YjiJ family MFS transporter [Paenibacillus]|uniref:YbfB/YjiJ family MFS transporter n=3 Tax=Paenibacillus validus TaxID=44253 RepID=A0A7X3CS16_9BACL|nr:MULTISPECIES: YbfB/YjiJ family MFS transporter [Paenibacillus]MUG69534.1 YbfB/YjiJ family MFS transporter [Paenibacillus validus]
MWNRNHNQSERKVMIGGILVLIIAMGIGRFAFTPIVPQMMEQGFIGEKEAGTLASANYLGYLAGSLIAAFYPPSRRRLFAIKSWLLVSVATTALVAAVESIPIWHVLRFVSGAASAFLFIYASSLVMDVWSLKKRASAAVSSLYTGVGLGITLAGLAVPFLYAAFGWKGSWWGLGVISLPGVALAWRWLRDVPAERTETAPSSPASLPAGRRYDLRQGWDGRLLAAYGLEGLGYIVTGTFLVAYAGRLPEAAAISSWSWVAVGLAAVPSGWVWSYAAERLGFRYALAAALAVQSIGIVLPVAFPTPAGVIGSAVLFGGTFIGIVTLAVSWGRALNPQRSGRTVGLLTAAYGTGQFIGPGAAGWLIAEAGEYATALFGAACIVAAGMLFLLAPLKERKSKQFLKG